MGGRKYIMPEVEYAGFWRRFAAHLLDNFILLFISVLVAIIGFSRDLAMLIVPLVYYTAFEGSSKQGTLGKQAMQIIVTDLDEKRVSYLRAFARVCALILVPAAFSFLYGLVSAMARSTPDDFTAMLVNFVVLALSCLVIFWTSKQQGLHDIFTGCLVIRDNRKTKPIIPKNLPE